MSQLSEIFTLLANAATFGGIVLAVILFFVERSRYRKDKELATYSATCSDYLDYLRLCIDHPEVSVVETGASINSNGTAKRTQRLILDIVVNMLERAYFLYRDHTSSLKKRQWEGWNQYISDWCQHPLFRSHWPDIVEQYDKEFVEHITKIYQSVNTSTES